MLAVCHLSLHSILRQDFLNVVVGRGLHLSRRDPPFVEAWKPLHSFCSNFDLRSWVQRSPHHDWTAVWCPHQVMTHQVLSVLLSVLLLLTPTLWDLLQA